MRFKPGDIIKSNTKSTYVVTKIKKSTYSLFWIQEGRMLLWSRTEGNCVNDVKIGEITELEKLIYNITENEGDT